MTITLQLTPQEEEKLTEMAAKVGLDPVSYLKRLIVGSDQESVTLADTRKSYIGVVDGTPGPGDGRAWAEIEAACDPLIVEINRTRVAVRP